MIRFNCKNCGQKIKVPHQLAGKKGRCPKCKQVIVIPSAEVPAKEPSTIKFRCPSCGQKIGLGPEYAGKRVRCAKCKKPLIVPQAPSRAERPAVKDETEVLRAGQEQRITEEDFFGGPEGTDELRLAEPDVPSIAKETEQSPAYAGQLAQPGSFVQTGLREDQPKKKHSIIFIAAVCIVALLLMGIAVRYFFIGTRTSESEIEASFPEVQKFAEDYIYLLNRGEIDKAIKLLSPQLQTDAEKSELERLVKYLNRSDIKQLNCRATNLEEHPEGKQFYLYYRFRYEDGNHRIVVSVLKTDEESSVSGIAVQEPFGNTISIGPHSFAELRGTAIAASAAKIQSFFTRFFCGLAIVILIACLVQVISMWIVFEKAGEPGWAVLVPGYNMWVLAEVGDKPGWLGLLMFFSGFIPYVGLLIGLVLSFVISIGVARAFGRSAGFGVGLALVPIVFYPILAFTSD